MRCAKTINMNVEAETITSLTGSGYMVKPGTGLLPLSQVSWLLTRPAANLGVRGHWDPHPSSRRARPTQVIPFPRAGREIEATSPNFRVPASPTTSIDLEPTIPVLLTQCPRDIRDRQLQHHDPTNLHAFFGPGLHKNSAPLTTATTTLADGRRRRRRRHHHQSLHPMRPSHRNPRAVLCQPLPLGRVGCWRSENGFFCPSTI
jgi:hypothetical protein